MATHQAWIEALPRATADERRAFALIVRVKPQNQSVNCLKGAEELKSGDEQGLGSRFKRT